MKKLALLLIVLCVVVYGNEAITTKQIQNLTVEQLAELVNSKRQASQQETIKKCLNGNMKSCEKALSFNHSVSEYISWEQYEKANNDFLNRHKRYQRNKRTKYLSDNWDILIRLTNINITMNCKDYMKVIKKGCALGSGLCCARLGDEYHPIANGNGQSYYGRDCSLRYQDETYKYYKKACELGESEGCQKYRELEHLIYEIDTRERDKTQKSDITIRRK